MTLLQKGDKAPDFTAQDQKGNDISLSSFRGKKLALYFYPRDLTPTCTDQACNLRDGRALLAEKNIVIIGVSDDPSAKHERFIEKHALNFPLIPDTNQELLKSYGVWGPKKFMGKEFDGTHRTTFLIDEEGTISEVISKVKAKSHTDQIIEGFGL